MNDTAFFSHGTFIYGTYSVYMHEYLRTMFTDSMVLANKTPPLRRRINATKKVKSENQTVSIASNVITSYYFVLRNVSREGILRRFRKIEIDRRNDDEK